MLPLSLIGIIVLGIGLLGLSPFVAAAVFARWGIALVGRGRRSWTEALAGAVLFAALCTGVHVGARQVWRSSLAAILSGSSADRTTATTWLRRTSLLLDLEGSFLTLWGAESDPTRKALLAEAYRGATGEDIEALAGRMAD
jgi:hypothetical protein